MSNPIKKLVIKMPHDSLNIVMFSGTADKFIPLGVFTQSAVNLNQPVRIFVTGWAIEGFKKNGHDHVDRVPKEFEDKAPALMKGLSDIKAPSWYEMLKSSKEMGDVKIYVCSMMAGAFKLDTRNDLDPIVDDVIGAAAFLQMSGDAQVIFI